jgi:hypothetical protein
MFSFAKRLTKSLGTQGGPKEPDGKAAQMPASFMRNNDNDNPFRFRNLAEQCRLQASKASDPRDKEAWLRLADDWIQMAENEERRRDQDGTS